jgi:hypothetical protein
MAIMTVLTCLTWRKCCYLVPSYIDVHLYCCPCMYDFSTSFVLCIWIYGNKNDDDDDDQCNGVAVMCGVKEVLLQYRHFKQLIVVSCISENSHYICHLCPSISTRIKIKLFDFILIWHCIFMYI